MTRIFRVIVGVGPAEAGALAVLAARLGDAAVSHGLTLKRIETTRCSVSRSRYLHLVDPQGREWLIRVSDHVRPERAGKLRPHLDLVSQDGQAGFDAGDSFVRRIAEGELAWYAPDHDPPRRRA